MLRPMDTRNRFTKWLALGFVLSLFLGLGACSSVSGGFGQSHDSAPRGHFDASNIPDAVPKAEPLSRYGNADSYVVSGKRYYVLKSAKGYDKVGNASWYGTKFHGQYTSSREPYNMFSMTAASTVLPIPCYVRVTNLKNNRSAIVKVNDRGPFHANRIIDLSYAAASKLGYADEGTARVRVTAIDAGAPTPNTVFAQNAVKDTPAPVAAKILAKKPVQLAQNSHNKAPVYLQVGAFKTRDKAVSVSQQVARIAQLDHAQVAVKEAYSSGKTRVYRVHIGPLVDDSKSKQVTQLLTQHGFSKPIPVEG